MFVAKLNLSINYIISCAIDRDNNTNMWHWCPPIESFYSKILHSPSSNMCVNKSKQSDYLFSTTSTFFPFFKWRATVIRPDLNRNLLDFSIILSFNVIGSILFKALSIG